MFSFSIPSCGVCSCHLHETWFLKHLRNNTENVSRMWKYCNKFCFLSILLFLFLYEVFFFSNISSFHIRAFWIIWLKLVKISFKSDFRILLRVKASKRKLKDDWLLTISWITQTKHILRGIFCGSDKKLYFFTIIQPLCVKVLRLLSQASKMSLLMLTLKSYE